MQLTKKPLVQTDALCVERGGKSILHEISLSIAHGEVVALLGANGSGKSTLLQAIVGLIPVSAGQVELCAGHDSASGIALVPQFAPATSLIPLTVFELVSTGLTNKRSILGLKRSEKDAVHDAIAQVGLSNYTKHKYSSLSGGQLRRALIARALVAKADLLLLDEPLTGLDRESIAAVVKVLQELKAAGFSMIVVSHELADLENLFTRVIELENRRVKYDGVPLPQHRHQPHPHHEPPRNSDLGLVP
ncbi:MAG: metal ABC transporter ATP-binding protein [Candidatus Nanopelagicales bacterium]